MSSVSDLSILSLFTGAGGMDLGFEAAGFEPVLCIEVDEDSRATLRHNRPNWRLAEPGNIDALDPDGSLAAGGTQAARSPPARRWTSVPTLFEVSLLGERQQEPPT